MANVKISALPTLSSVSDTDVLPIVNSSTTKQVTALNLKNYVGAGGTYSNTNVAAYLTSNPPAGTYSNTNVASYLPVYSGNVLAANIIQTSTGQVTTPAGSNANLTLNPDGSGWVVVTNITPVFLGNTLQVRDVRDTVYTIATGSGTSTGTITPDAANGDMQVLNLSGSVTFNAFNNPMSGQTVTFAVVQPGSGGPYTLTSSMKFAGGNKTLSTAASAVDLLTVTYVNSTIGYLASLVTGFA